MSVDIFWIPYNGPGRIGIATRPRGGDWLKDDIIYLHRSGTDLLVSMLTPKESRELHLEMEEKVCQDEGINFQCVPIQDRGVPSSIKDIAVFALQYADFLENGSNIIIHLLNFLEQLLEKRDRFGGDCLIIIFVEIQG